MSSPGDSLVFNLPRIRRCDSSDFCQVLHCTYIHSQPIMISTWRLTSELQSKVSQVAMAPMEACGAP